MTEPGPLNRLTLVSPAVPATTERPALGPTFRNVQAKTSWSSLTDVESLYELFGRSVKKFAANPCLGVRLPGATADAPASDFVYETYAQVAEKVAQVASCVRGLGVEPHGKLGVFGANSPEWMIAMQAANSMSLYTVPLYDSLGAEAVEYIIIHADCSVVFCQASKMSALVKALPRCPNVRAVIYWGTGAGDAPAAVAKLGVKVLDWAACLAEGKAHPVKPAPPSSGDLCTIMYTSGTTGAPKGVMLTHAMVLASVAGLLGYVAQNALTVDSTDVILSYLPLAHIFERMAEETMLYLGSRIAYWQGDIKKLVDDIGFAKPTIFVGVPRIFDRIYAGVQAKLAGSMLKKLLFNWGYARKLHFMNAGKPQKKASPFFDALVFNTIKQRLGGKVKLVISGGAPLAAHVEEFLRVTMCCPVGQGYGLTESCAASFITVPDHAFYAGTIGLPLSGAEFRLEAVPEMKYDPAGTPPRGELCLRGPTIFKGYYKQQALTDEVLDADGWFHTGDIGELKGDAMRIIDRKKNIFKLAQGEYVAVEKIENVLGQCAVVESVWVYGNSLESFLVAVACPNEKALHEWAEKTGAVAAGASPTPASSAALASKPEARAYVLEQLTAAAKAGKLQGFEVPKAVHLDSIVFDLERDLLTPTFKKKRPQLLAHYKAAVDDMYAVTRKALEAKEKAAGH